MTEDLKRYKPKPEKRFWVNIYDYLITTCHFSRKEADEAAMTSQFKRIACLEFVEGDGLDE